MLHPMIYYLEKWFYALYMFFKIPKKEPHITNQYDKQETNVGPNNMHNTFWVL
jgi:hypothetical protein